MCSAHQKYLGLKYYDICTLFKRLRGKKVYSEVRGRKRREMRESKCGKIFTGESTVKDVWVFTVLFFQLSYNFETFHN